jgi:hypothetical protein
VEVEAVEAEVEEEAVVEAEEAHQHRWRQQPLNNRYPSWQMSKPWEDFPKYSMEIVPEPTTSSKR